MARANSDRHESLRDPMLRITTLAAVSRAKDAVVGRKHYPMGQPAAAPQLLFMEAAAAEAHVMRMTGRRSLGECRERPIQALRKGPVCVWPPARACALCRGSRLPWTSDLPVATRRAVDVSLRTRPSLVVGRWISGLDSASERMDWSLEAAQLAASLCRVARSRNRLGSCSVER